MIPSSFKYVAPKTLDEAVRLLGENGSEAKLLGGGQSLIPLMKFRLATPGVLIDLGRIPQLRFIREEGDDIVVGSMTTHHMLESSALLREKAPLLALTAAHIGDVQVRNRGTLGGSLTHADPASDLPAAVLALDARMKVVGAGGEREISANDFFVDMLQSAVGAGEILTEIRIKKAAVGSGAAYLKVPHPASGFAVVGVATILTLSGASCQSIAIGITGVASKPYRANAVEASLRGNQLNPPTLLAACARATQGVEAQSDAIYASAEYRTVLAQVYTRRSVEAAAAKAGG